MAQPRPAALPTLTNIRAVHLLSYDQAIRAYPVHFTAIVTYYDPYLNHPNRPILMVTDHTGSIYLALPGETTMPLRAGTVLDVRGVSGPGDFAPRIDHAVIRILGQSATLPRAPRESLTHILSASEDAEWCEMEGVVQSVEEVGNNVTLKLGLADGVMAATTVKEPGADYASLIDATVSIRGIAGSLFTRQRQKFSVQLLFPNLSAVHVVQPAPSNPYDTPISPIGDLMRYAKDRILNHRVHLRGIVTLFWPGRLLCIQSITQEALCAGTAQTTPLVIGQQADVIGFPEIGDVTPTLIDATGQPVRSPAAISAVAVPVSGEEALSGQRDSQLVQIDATVAAHDRASQDPIIVVSSGKFTFSVVLPKSADATALLALEEGTRIRITGICSVEADSKVFTRHDGYPVTRYFRIMLRSTDDLVVLERPSWWNARHTLLVLAFALVITLGVLCWVILLRSRVKQQTELLRHQATHDALTGIWNRRAVLDMLQREFEIAARAHSLIGIMMLDADHFKRINDTYGHQAGDLVLKELTRRIQSSLRSFDLSGRYGGEEFLVIVPGCNADQVMKCAERIRAAVADSPIDAEGVPLSVTVSIGTAVLDPILNSQQEALAAADGALYRAKNSGRNRVISAEENISTPQHPRPVSAQADPLIAR
jgi:diguanylate cyclase (GGDEF)-like protein